jgi:hypothetical protein
VERPAADLMVHLTDRGVFSHLKVGKAHLMVTFVV